MPDVSDEPSPDGHLTPVDLPIPTPSSSSPSLVRGFRSQLTVGEDVVDL